MLAACRRLPRLDARDARRAMGQGAGARREPASARQDRGHRRVRRDRAAGGAAAGAASASRSSITTRSLRRPGGRGRAGRAAACARRAAGPGRRGHAAPAADAGDRGPDLGRADRGDEAGRDPGERRPRRAGRRGGAGRGAGDGAPLRRGARRVLGGAAGRQSAAGPANTVVDAALRRGDGRQFRGDRGARGRQHAALPCGARRCRRPTWSVGAGAEQPLRAGAAAEGRVRQREGRSDGNDVSRCWRTRSRRRARPSSSATRAASRSS